MSCDPAKNCFWRGCAFAICRWWQRSSAPAGATPVPGATLPLGPAGSAEGAQGAGGRDADGRSGSSPQAPAGSGQGDAPSDEPRSSLPGLFEVTAAGSSLWARLARWLNPDSPRAESASKSPSDRAAAPVSDTFTESSQLPPTLSGGTESVAVGAHIAQPGAGSGSVEGGERRSSTSS